MAPAMKLMAGLLILLVLPMPVSAQAADTAKAQEAFESLFGEALRKAQATRGDNADDLVLAAKMLDAARTSEQQPAFQILLCEKAAELSGNDPKGFETAQAAARLLIEKSPEKEPAARELLIKIEQRRYDIVKGSERLDAAQDLIENLMTLALAKARAGETDETLKRCRQATSVIGGLPPPLPEGYALQSKRIAELMRIATRVNQLKGLIKMEPAKAATRDELVRLMLAELDSPAAATQYLADSSDADLRKYLPALCRKIGEAPELACMELGDWLRSQGEAAAGAGKYALLHRSLAYYDRYLDLHKTADMDRTKAEVAQKKLQADLDKMGDVFALTASVSIDLLKAFSGDKEYVLAGTWERKGEELHGTARAGDYSSYNGRAVIPLMPQGNYEVEMRFSKTGPGGVWVHLPLANAEVMVSVGAGTASSSYYGYSYKPAVATLEQVSRSSYRDDIASTLRATLDDNHAYLLQVRVTTAGEKASIVVALEGRTVISWSGNASDLSVYSYWKQASHPRCLGVGVGNPSTITLHSARLRMLTGKAVAPEKPPAPPTPAAAPTGSPTKTGPAKSGGAGGTDSGNGAIRSTAPGHTIIIVRPGE
jgi:hypothetical protein